jgi:hypothetical protein
MKVERRIDATLHNRRKRHGDGASSSASDDLPSGNDERYSGATGDDNAHNRREACEDRRSLTRSEPSTALHMQACNDEQYTQGRSAGHGQG